MTMTTSLHRFASDLGLEGMQPGLARAGCRTLLRRYRVDYLTTPVAEIARGRVRLEAQSAGWYLLHCWDRDDADQLLAAAGAREAKSIPIGPGAGAECAAFTFSSRLDLAAMTDRIPRVAGEPWVATGSSLSAVATDQRRLEEVRWRIARADRGFTLEVTHDANPHDESRWRRTCDTALSDVLPALAASSIQEPESWAIKVPEARLHRAWSYASGKTLAEQRAALEKATGETWQERDSEHYGDYLSSGKSAPYAERTRLRVFEAEGRFVLDVRWSSERPGADPEPVERRAESLLPALGASDIRPDEGYD
jgi:hypothetical protein